MTAPPPAFIDTYPVEEDEKKVDLAHIEATDDVTALPLRSMCDDWTPRQTVTRFWKAVVLCVFIGLSAAADGFSVSNKVPEAFCASTAYQNGRSDCILSLSRILGFYDR